MKNCYQKLFLIKTVKRKHLILKKDLRESILTENPVQSL